MNTFENMQYRFVLLCAKYNMPVPLVKPSLPDDPCDFTSPSEVRFNVVAAGNINPEKYAAHVFGHYICDLHEASNNGEIDLALCDSVADLIANLVVMRG